MSFAADYWNAGGRKLILDNMSFHHKALDNMKSVVSTRRKRGHKRRKSHLRKRPGSAYNQGTIDS